MQVAGADRLKITSYLLNENVYHITESSIVTATAVDCCFSVADIRSNKMLTINVVLIGDQWTIRLPFIE